MQSGRKYWVIFHKLDKDLKKTRFFLGVRETRRRKIFHDDGRVRGRGNL